MQSVFGISEHVHPELSGFYGIIKHKYSDFVVREICNEEHIISISSSETTSLEHIHLSSEQHDGIVNKGEAILSNDLPKLLEEIYFSYPNDYVISWTRSIRALFASNSCSKSAVTLPSIADKSKRRKLHEFFQNDALMLLDSSQKYYMAFQTTTILPENQIIISFDKLSSHSRKRKHGSISLPRFIRLYLLKRNKDTIESIQRVASFLKIPDKNLSFAGTKDRRAITFQCISLKDPSSCFKGDTWKTVIDGLETLNKGLSRHGITILLPSSTKERYIDHHLQLGELYGNQFDIIIRDIKLNQASQFSIENHIEVALKTLITDGFINYYGSQRFGHSQLVPTWKIGLAFLKRDWMEVIRLLLEPRNMIPDQDDVDSDVVRVENARKMFWVNKNAQGAFALLSRKWVAERSIVSYYKDSPELLDSFENPLEAIERIPHELRMLYLHSLQSYIWNHVASERIKLDRLRPIIGDMIMPDKTIISSAEELLDINVDTVILPLPGSSILEYPHKHLYNSVVKEKLGLELNVFSNQDGKYNLQGDYRKLIVKPGKFQWKLFYYSSPEEIFQTFDGSVVSFSRTNGSGTYIGLLLSFQLSSSSYATMMLEELMKCNTCSEYQKTLGNS